jgi:hypothetical protein
VAPRAHEPGHPTGRPVDVAGAHYNDPGVPDGGADAGAGPHAHGRDPNCRGAAADLPGERLPGEGR